MSLYGWPSNITAGHVMINLSLLFRISESLRVFLTNCTSLLRCLCHSCVMVLSKPNHFKK